MRIGIDIDGVLTNIEQFSLNYFTKYCVENKIAYKIGNPSYELSDIFNVDKSVTNDFWEKHIFYYAENENPRPYAKEVIDKLKDMGNEVYILTARWLTNQDDINGIRMREVVKKWLDKNEIYYDKLIFLKADRERKEDEIKDYKIDLMIEDNPNNIRELSRITKVICYDTSYNKDCCGENIYRCYSWYDILNYIDKMK